MSPGWPQPAPARADVPRALARGVGRAAIRALYDELALYPKPGLVSFQDCGSHDDMDARTFWRSLFALRRYFPEFVVAGATCAPFGVLQRIGVEAECAMLRATGGANTHRGAIFTLGLLCAGAGDVLAQRRPITDRALRATLTGSWRQDLLHKSRQPGASHGRRAVQQLGLRGAAQEAAAGFPVLFDVTVPAWRHALAHTGDLHAARLQALFATMAVLDDTNLAHRGGLHGLRWAQRQARDFLAGGGALAPDAYVRARALHAAFVARRLSPGGAADLLAAACWLHALTG